MSFPSFLREAEVEEKEQMGSLSDPTWLDCVKIMIKERLKGRYTDEIVQNVV
jgi:hypothetical protein